MFLHSKPNLLQSDSAVVANAQSCSLKCAEQNSAVLLFTHMLLGVQVLCYEDSRLMKIFTDVIKLLYNSDIIAEDTIHHWYKKGSHPKGRNVFLKDAEPFVKWLEEAEEEEEDEEEE